MIWVTPVLSMAEISGPKPCLYTVIQPEPQIPKAVGVSHTGPESMAYSAIIREIINFTRAPLPACSSHYPLSPSSGQVCHLPVSRGTEMLLSRTLSLSACPGTPLDSLSEACSCFVGRSSFD